MRLMARRVDASEGLSRAASHYNFRNHCETLSSDDPATFALIAFPQADRVSPSNF
jgi:hypothetical protein